MNPRHWVLVLDNGLFFVNYRKEGVVVSKYLTYACKYIHEDIATNKVEEFKKEFDIEFQVKELTFALKGVNE